MEPRRLVQAVVMIAVLAAGAFVILQVTDGWSSWVVLGFFVVGIYGTALAVDDATRVRRGRTFVRHWDEPK